jgi:hypothetical protein
MKDATCDWLDDYLADWLDEDHRRAFDVHLAECEACAKEVRLQCRIDGLLAVSPPAAPAGLKTAIARAIRRRKMRTVVRLAAAAVLLLGAAAGWRWWIDADRPPLASEDYEFPKTETTEHDSQSNALEPLEKKPQVPAPFIAEQPPAVAELNAGLVRVDAGSAIVVAEPSSDPTVHIFWVYPTVDISFRDSADPSSIPSLERNPL